MKNFERGADTHATGVNDLVTLAPIHLWLLLFYHHISSIILAKTFLPHSPPPHVGLPLCLSANERDNRSLRSWEEQYCAMGTVVVSVVACMLCSLRVEVNGGIMFQAQREAVPQCVCVLASWLQMLNIFFWPVFCIWSIPLQWISSLHCLCQLSLRRTVVLKLYSSVFLH